MSRIAAVVGSKAGWFVLRETPLPGPWSWFVAATFEDAIGRLENYEVIAVDAPLSLSEIPEQADDAVEPGIRDRYRRPPEHRPTKKPGSARLSRQRNGKKSRT